MSDEQLRFPRWQAPLQELIAEFDRETLAEKVQRVETLMSERLQQPFQSMDDHSEREALNHGLFIVQMIKRDRLGVLDLK
jgi:hypothetical protein